MAGRINVEENKTAEPTVFLYVISVVVRMKYDTSSSASLNTSHSSTDDTTVGITAVPHFLTEHRIKKCRNFSLHNYRNGESVIKSSVIFFATKLALSNVKPRKMVWA
jgi:hypothetical protein